MPSLKGANKWSIPGGGLEKGETHMQGLLRELKEEINIIPSDIEYLGSIGFLFLKHSLYLVRLTEKEFKMVKLDNEGQKLGWFKIGELKNIELTSTLTKYFNKYSNQLKEMVEDNKMGAESSIFHPRQKLPTTL